MPSNIHVFEITHLEVNAVSIDSLLVALTS